MQWEYLHQYIAIIGDSPLEKELQKYGDKGWELVSIDPNLLDGALDGFAVFKRPKPVTLPSEFGGQRFTLD